MRRRLHSLGLIGVTPLVALAAVPGCRDAATQTRPTAFDQTLVGTVLRYQDRAPVSGATVSFGSSSAVTNQAGRFQLVGVPGSGAVRLTAAAQGYLERATWVEIRESNGPVSFDMVHDSTPFSLGYYREFARNAHERPDPARSANPPCQYPALEIANHEIVHTMGFRHTDLSWFDDPWAENTVRTIDCMGTRAELVRYHAAVAYSRPRLNMDQDQDPVRLTAMAQTTSRQAKAGPETFCPIPTGER